MPNLPEKNNCCGCGACSQICPQKAISMYPDSEGFIYPSVDNEKCINCSMCEKICPGIELVDSRKPRKTYALINRDEKIRLHSSSGGAFYALANSIVQSGGVVFGACFDEEWQVIHKSAFSPQDIIPFMGSKYVQSRTGNTFAECKKHLEEGRNVLYSGTPCQISGLHHFLRKEYDNLLTVDVICHGAPSPKVWNKYLENLAERINNVKNINMRNKDKGWANYEIVIDYRTNEKDLQYRSLFRDDRFMQAFLKDMILRPSCYDCSSKSLRSGSDITIGDYWGIDNVLPEFNDNKGVSIVLVNTEKGSKAVKGLNLDMRETSYENGLKGNPAILKSPRPWPRRDYFFSKLDSCKDVSKLISDSLVLPISAKERMKRFVKAIMEKKCYHRLKKLWDNIKQYPL